MNNHRRYDRLHLVRQMASKSSSNVSKNKQNLYTILEASIDDTPTDIKRHYRSLVKRMHPDSGNDNKYTTEEFTLVTEAYSTLSDPKRRLQYDRSLRARKITSLMGSIFDVSLKGADTIFRKTADTAEVLAPKVGKVADDVGERVGLARERFALESKIRELEQKASKIESQASKLKKQIENISSKRLPSLSKNSYREPLTSEESNQILQSFQSIDRRLDTSDENTPNEPKITYADQLILNDINTLTEKESDYTDSKVDVQVLDNQVRTAEREVDTAVDAQTKAQQRLEKLTRELAEANDAVRLRKKSLMEKEGERSRAEERAKRVNGSLESQMEKVRTKLRMREGSAFEKEVSWMQDENNRLEKEAKNMKDEALTFAKKLEDI